MSADQQGNVTEEARQLVLQRTLEYFPPELINRLDSLLVFNRLSKSSILDIVSLRLEDVAARLKPKRITMEVTPAARGWLAEKGYSDVYGARAIARVVRTEVLFPLAEKMLKGTIRWVFLFLVHPVPKSSCSTGDTVKIDVGSDSGSLAIPDLHTPDSSSNREVDISVDSDH
jgi:ATP-dependent Clp protease ATP-binding subunit ClpB